MTVRHHPAERVLAALAFLLASAALLPLLGEAGGVAVDGWATALWSVVYVGAGAVVVAKRLPVGSVLARNAPLAAIPALMAVSALWSLAPAVTLERAVVFALTTAVGVYVGCRFGVERFGDVLAWTLAAIALLSLGLALADPALGLDHIRGDAWRGAFLTKNELGRMMVLGALVWAVRAVTLRGHLFVSASFAGLCGLLAFRSESRTSMLVLALLALLLLALPALRARYRIAIPAVCVVVGAGIAAGSWLFDHADATLSAVGSDATFTGRDAIWSAVWTFVEARPWTGYGFGAFWRGVDGPSAYVWSAVGSTPPHSHNGVLDLWLDVGIFGVALVAVAVAGTAVRAMRALRQRWAFATVWPIAYVVFLVLFNFSESSLASPFSPFWLVFVATATQLAAAEPVAGREPVAQRARLEPLRGT